MRSSHVAIRVAVFTAGLFLAAMGHARAQAVPLITKPIDNAATVILKGNVHPLANSANDRGAVRADHPMTRVLLELKRSPQQEKALQAAIDALHKPGSPTFHKWMTPAELASKYAPAQADLDKVVVWLQSQGMTVTSVAPSHMTIEFSGAAQSISTAFHTQLHQYAWDGQVYTANASDPQIPEALSAVVKGPVALNNFPLKQNHSAVRLVQYDKKTKKWTVKSNDISKSSLATLPGSAETSASGPRSDITIQDNNGDYFFPVGPADFAKIYNVQPLWDAGIDGTGQQIAIIGQTDISSTDVDQFRQAFGLPATHLNMILNGPDPGTLTADVVEATLDVEWSGAVAKNATIDFVTSGTTDTTDGIILSALYVIENNVAPVASLSYGGCEASLGDDGNFFFYQLWQSAAAEGITPIVASGDTGDDTCDDGSSFASNGTSVNGFGSSPYNISVGGTDFKVSANDPAQYWAQYSDYTTLESALSYIPEVPWNGSCAGPDVDSLLKAGYRTSDPEALCNLPALQGQFLTLNGGGGGASSCTTTDPVTGACLAGWPQPAWQQNLNGIPDGSTRYLPDVSLFASNGVFNSDYVFCYSELATLTTPNVCNFTDPNDVTLLGAGGTSFAAPAFAGIMSLVNQKANSAQGDANYILYGLAKAQYGTTTAPLANKCDASLGTNSDASCVFHDISTGSNAQPCLTGSPGCVTKDPVNDNIGILPGFNSSTGYDAVTGLGSVNAYNLVMNWATASQAETATTTTLAAAPATSVYGQRMKLSGAVTPSSGTATPTGTVTFLGMQNAAQASFDLTNGTYSGSTGVFPAGSYTLQANYMGDGSFQPSSSTPVALQIAQAPPTATLSFEAVDTRSLQVISQSNQIPFGSAVVPILTVQGPTGAGILPPTGAVTFSSNNSSLGTTPLNGDQASAFEVTSQIGAASVTAVYSGDANYLSGTPVTGSYTVVQANSVLTVHPSVSALIGTGSLTLTAALATHSYTAPPTGVIKFYVNGNLVGIAPVQPATDPQTSAWVDTASATVYAGELSAGTNLVKASYSGDANYNSETTAAPVSVTYGATSITPAISLTANSAAITSGGPVTLNATVSLSGTPATVGVVTFFDGGQILASVPVAGATPATGATTGVAKFLSVLTNGTHSITAVYNGVQNVIASVTSSPVSVAVSGNLTSTSTISATPNATNGTNYDFLVETLVGGTTTPTGSLTVDEPAFSNTLGQVSIDPSMVSVGTLTKDTLTVTGSPQLMTTTDVNGDGIPDLVVMRAADLSEAAQFLTNLPQLYIYPGKGDGTFLAPLISTVNTDPNLGTPYGVAAGDFNGDGVTDLAFGFEFGGNITILLGKGDGTFQNGPIVSFPGALPLLSNLVVGDFNHDGILDLVTCEATSGDIGDFGGVVVMLGNGDGSFTVQPRINRGGIRFIRTADVNKDGNDDLVYSLPYSNAIGVRLGNADGTFGSETTFPTGLSTWGLTIGDLNKDGYPDVVTANPQDNTVTALINQKDGTFVSASYPVATFPQMPAIGDINHDGYPDVVVSSNTSSSAGALTVLYGSADGTLSPGVTLLTNDAPEDVLLTDLNHDGIPDIVVAEAEAGTVGVFLAGNIVTTTLTNVPVTGPVTDQENVTASYSGDTTYLASTSAPFSLRGSGAQAATKVAWSPTVSTGIYGSALPAGVFNAAEAHGVAGTFAYSAQVATGQTVTISAGATLPSVGSYVLTAAFTPKDTVNYSASSTTIPFAVTKADVSHSLNASITQIAQGASVTFTDTLKSATSGTPTGFVNFLSGGNSIGAAQLDSTGIATLTTNTLPAGTTSITASYVGDSDFNASISTGLSVQVGAPTFTTSLSASTLNISAGGTGSLTLSLTPQFGYTGNVTFSCASLFAGASCSFAPANGAVTASGMQTTITINTVPATPAVTAKIGSTSFVAVGGASTLAGLLLLLVPRKKRRSLRNGLWIAPLLLVAVSAFTVGCGGNSAPVASTLSLSSSNLKAASGTPITLQAAVQSNKAASAVGAVVFYEGTVSIGQPVEVQQGKATLTLPNPAVGTHLYTASYSGDSFNEASKSQALQQVITGTTTIQVVTTGSDGQSQVANVAVTLQ